MNGVRNRLKSKHLGRPWNWLRFAVKMEQSHFQGASGKQRDSDAHALKMHNEKEQPQSDSKFKKRR